MLQPHVGKKGDTKKYTNIWLLVQKEDKKPGACVILATWEVEIRRIVFQSQPRQIIQGLVKWLKW
jgi:hypothetical protein